jgi:hypothetical protein
MLLGQQQLLRPCDLKSLQHRKSFVQKIVDMIFGRRMLVMSRISSIGDGGRSWRSSLLRYGRVLLPLAFRPRLRWPFSLVATAAEKPPADASTPARPGRRAFNSVGRFYNAESSA